MEVNVKLDCRGMSCPMPVFKTSKALKNLKVGETLEVISSDPGFVLDIQALIRQTQNKLLVTQEMDNHVFRYVIEKTQQNLG
ncbi:MAG: sulfurtransferase TusA family protein [Bacteroidetes bacterium]|nr:sulfurtransferase TusA family protein [Bacteroidota bacterium]